MTNVLRRVKWSDDNDSYQQTECRCFACYAQAKFNLDHALRHANSKLIDFSSWFRFTSREFEENNTGGVADET